MKMTDPLVEKAKEILKCKTCNGDGYIATHSNIFNANGEHNCSSCPIQGDCPDCYHGTIEGNYEKIISEISSAISNYGKELREENKSLETDCIRLQQYINCLEIGTVIPDLKKQLKSSKKVAVDLLKDKNKLRKERCYICRPNDKKASEEGCSDCDEKSDMNHKLVKMLQELQKLQFKNKKLTSSKKAAFEELSKLKKFLEWLFAEVFEGSPDGGDIQDKAEEMGILVEVKIPKDKIEEYSHHDFIDLDNPYLFFPYWAAESILSRIEEKK